MSPCASTCRPSAAAVTRTDSRAELKRASALAMLGALASACVINASSVASLYRCHQFAAGHSPLCAFMAVDKGAAVASDGDGRCAGSPMHALISTANEQEA